MNWIGLFSKYDFYFHLWVGSPIQLCSSVGWLGNIPFLHLFEIQSYLNWINGIIDFFLLPRSKRIIVREVSIGGKCYVLKAEGGSVAVSLSLDKCFSTNLEREFVIFQFYTSFLDFFFFFSISFLGLKTSLLFGALYRSAVFSLKNL